MPCTYAAHLLWILVMSMELVTDGAFGLCGAFFFDDSETTEISLSCYPNDHKKLVDISNSLEVWNSVLECFACTPELILITKDFEASINYNPNLHGLRIRYSPVSDKTYMRVLEFLADSNYHAEVQRGKFGLAWEKFSN